MGILETSLDLLYITLSIAIIAVTVFLCWGMYYLIRILKNAVYMVEKVTVVMRKADEVLDLIKDKLNSSGTYLGIVASAVQSAITYFGEVKEAKPKRRARKKKS